VTRCHGNLFLRKQYDRPGYICSLCGESLDTLVAAHDHFFGDPFNNAPLRRDTKNGDEEYASQ
jgi:hypothetical protein